MTTINTKRRNFMAGTGSLLALSALSPNVPTVFASEQKQAQESIVVFRAEDERSVEFASVFAEAGSSVMALSVDPVRQWRDGFSAALSNKKRLIGLTTWADFLLMRELAAEQRRFPVLELQHAVSQQNNNDWASKQAQEILLASESGNENYRNLKTKEQLNGKTLFSWVIT